MTQQGDLPRYQQIFLLLREKILTGQVPSGARITSEAELSKEFGVSRITSRRALSELERAGLVTRERGRGTRVRENIIGDSAPGEAAGNVPMTSRILGQSRIIGQSEVRLLGFSRQPAPAHVNQALALEPQSDVYVVERVRSSKGDPFCHLVTYVPIEIGRTFSPAALESRMLIDLIQETGRTIGSAEQTVGATIADAILAGHLDVQRGAPILHVARTVYDADGVPVEYFEASFRPDKFRLSMSLEHGGTTAGLHRATAAGIG